MGRCLALQGLTNGIIAHLEKGNSYTIIKEFKNYIKNVPHGTFYRLYKQ